MCKFIMWMAGVLGFVLAASLVASCTQVTVRPDSGSSVSVKPVGDGQLEVAVEAAGARQDGSSTGTAKVSPAQGGKARDAATANIAEAAKERATAEADAAKAIKERDLATAGAADAAKERDAAKADAAKAIKERDLATAGAADAAKERNTAKADAAKAIKERDVAAASAVEAAKERDVAKADAAKAIKERDLATASAADAAKERDAAKADAAKAIKERDDAAAGAAEAAKERDTAKADAAKAIKERDGAAASAAEAAKERDAARANAAKVVAVTDASQRMGTGTSGKLWPFVGIFAAVIVAAIAVMVFMFRKPIAYTFTLLDEDSKTSHRIQMTSADRVDLNGAQPVKRAGAGSRHLPFLTIDRKGQLVLHPMAGFPVKLNDRLVSSADTPMVKPGTVLEVTANGQGNRFLVGPVSAADKNPKIAVKSPVANVRPA